MGPGLKSKPGHGMKSRACLVAVEEYVELIGFLTASNLKIVTEDLHR